MTSQIAERTLKISISDRIVAEQCIARKDALSLWMHAYGLAESLAGSTVSKSEWWFSNVIEPLAKRYVEALGGTYEIWAGMRYVLGRRISCQRGKWCVDDYRP